MKLRSCGRVPSVKGNRILGYSYVSVNDEIITGKTVQFIVYIA